MAVLQDRFCRVCGHVFIDVWSDDIPSCCGAESTTRPHVIKTNEWGSPRTLLHLRDEPFSSRSELASYAKAHGLALGASNDRVGGARNEDHLHLGKKFSYAKQEKR